jgi:hypothetical protein
MSVNIENIDKTIARIRQNQNFRFNMSSWGGAISHHDETTDQEHFCGTSACIAGFAVLASGKYPIKKQVNDKGVTLDVLDIPVMMSQHEDLFLRDGAELLGLSRRQAVALFTPWRTTVWDDEGKAYAGPDYFKATEDEGIAVLEHLKTTGIVDWSVSGIKGDSGFEDTFRSYRGRDFSVAVPSEEKVSENA